MSNELFNDKFSSTDEEDRMQMIFNRMPSFDHFNSQNSKAKNVTILSYLSSYKQALPKKKKEYYANVCIWSMFYIECSNSV